MAVPSARTADTVATQPPQIATNTAALAAQEPAREEKVPPLSSKPGQAIFFPDNKQAVDEKDEALLRGHADKLKANRRLAVTLVAHISDDGSRNYNLAQMQIWIDSISATLQSYGVRAGQIRKERRAEHLPATCSKACRNERRRVDLIYRK